MDDQEIHDTLLEKMAELYEAFHMPVAGLKSTNNTLSRQHYALKIFEEICLLAPIMALVLSCKFDVMEMLI